MCSPSQDSVSISVLFRHIRQSNWKKKKPSTWSRLTAEVGLAFTAQPTTRNLALATPSQPGLIASNSRWGQIPRFQNSVSLCIQEQADSDSRQRGNQFFQSSWQSLVAMSLPDCGPRLPSQALAAETSLPAPACSLLALDSLFGKLCTCLDARLTSCNDSYTHPPLQSILLTSFPPLFLKAS